jgi:hypothetical protein
MFFFDFWTWSILLMTVLLIQVLVYCFLVLLVLFTQYGKCFYLLVALLRIWCPFIVIFLLQLVFISLLHGKRCWFLNIRLVIVAVLIHTTVKWHVILSLKRYRSMIIFSWQSFFISAHFDSALIRPALYFLFRSNMIFKWIWNKEVFCWI